MKNAIPNPKYVTTPFVFLNLRKVMTKDDELLSRFSSSNDRRDQGPNRLLAREIAKSSDRETIADLIRLLKAGQPGKLENDILLCLATLSESTPEFLASYAETFIQFLSSKNNRSIMGAMITLAHIAPFAIEIVKKHLVTILKAMDEGSVVTRDHGFVILLHLYLDPKQREDVRSLIIEQLHIAPDNQLGQYAEKYLKLVNSDDLDELKLVLESRQPYLEKTAHQNRIAKILKKIYAK
jgi:hypothetical protein